MLYKRVCLIAFLLLNTAKSIVYAQQPNEAYLQLNSIFNNNRIEFSQKVESLRLVILNENFSCHSDSLLPISFAMHADAHQKLNQQLHGLAYMIQGRCAYEVPNYPKAQKFYRKALHAFQLASDTLGIGMAQFNIGECYFELGLFIKSMDHYLQSLELFNKIQYKSGFARAMNNIGLLYNEQKDYSKALEYYRNALVIAQALNDKILLAASYNNIGMVYIDKANYKTALDYMQQSLDIELEMGNVEGIIESLINIGVIHDHQEEFKSAESYYKQALDMAIYHHIQRLQIHAYGNLGQLYTSLKRFNDARKLITISLKMAKQINSRIDIKFAYNYLYELDSITGNYTSAFRNYKHFIAYRDSLANEQSLLELKKRDEIFRMNIKITADSVKTATFNNIMKSQLAVQTVKINSEKRFRYLLSAGIFILLVLGGVIYNRLVYIRKQKTIIEEKNTLVQEQNIRVEAKNKEILDSIQYAKTLQNAILPPLNLFRSYFPDSFVIYIPKDIVAGDFYWLESSDNSTFLAVGDCTGHGVPGAMVSVVCSNALNSAIKEHHLTEPGLILDKTREMVIDTFDKSTAKVRDGMDITLLSLSTDFTLKWSGANIPLWVFNKQRKKIPDAAFVFEGNVGFELKPDIYPIGFYYNSKPYKTHTVSLEPGDTVLLFSDGFADQFGGKVKVGGKKLKSKNFIKLLASVQDLSMQQQRAEILAFFQEWKGDYEQIDDVCIIGFRV